MGTGPLDFWIDATKRAAGALLSGAAAWREESERLVAENVERIARRFRGREIVLRGGGKSLRGVLVSLELRGSSGRAAELVLSDALWSAMRVRTLSIVAEQLAMTPPPSVGVTLHGMRVTGEMEFAELIAWVDERVPQWTLTVDHAGMLRATSLDGTRRFALEPVVIGGQLEVEVRGVSFHGVGARVPRWLRVTRKIPLPLPEGVSITEARKNGQDVAFALTLPPVTRSFDLLTP
jgi:hypothetical protein